MAGSRDRLLSPVPDKRMRGLASSLSFLLSRALPYWSRTEAKAQSQGRSGELPTVNRDSKEAANNWFHTSSPGLLSRTLQSTLLATQSFPVCRKQEFEGCVCLWPYGRFVFKMKSDSTGDGTGCFAFPEGNDLGCLRGGSLVLVPWLDLLKQSIF